MPDAHRTKDQYVDIVFDGPPSHESGRFVEVEDADGRSIRYGEWIDRRNGLWALRVPRATPETDALRRFAEWAAGASCHHDYAPRMVKHIAENARAALNRDNRTGALPPEGLITGRAAPTALRYPASAGENQGEATPSAEMKSELYLAAFGFHDAYCPSCPDERCSLGDALANIRRRAMKATGDRNV